MKKPKEKTISDFLVNERKKRCLTQAEMAEKLGVTRCYYVMLEKGYKIDGRSKKVTPGRELIKKIAELTGYTIESIYGLIQKEKKEGN